MRIPCGQGILAVCALAAVACRGPAPPIALAPLDVPIRADIHHLAVGADSVQLAVRALLRNPFADTLTLETTCGGVALRLEFADGSTWRPVLDGLESRPCLLMYTELRLAPRDSVVVADATVGIRSDRQLGVRWKAPLPGRYRLTTTASRCMRHTRRDCWVTLASAPFDVGPVATNGSRP